jgi:folylpolyglutamate synthase/dihydropteroate synthase
VLTRDKKTDITSDQILAAAHTLVPARMEIFKYKDKTIVLDGAHNAQKLHALINSLRARYPDQSVAALVSFVDGRSFRLESSLQELTHITKSLTITTFHAGQDMPHGAVQPNILVELAKEAGFGTIKVVEDPKKALNELLQRPETILLITGSFFLMFELRPEVQKL